MTTGSQSRALPPPSRSNCFSFSLELWQDKIQSCPSTERYTEMLLEKEIQRISKLEVYHCAYLPVLSPGFTRAGHQNLVCSNQIESFQARAAYSSTQLLTIPKRFRNIDIVTISRGLFNGCFIETKEKNSIYQMKTPYDLLHSKLKHNYFH